MTYPETIDFLFTSLPVFHNVGGSAYKPGLDNIEALEKSLGDPHRKFRSVHIAGTNGKGSVSHMTAAVLHASGCRTGLFTSPHMKDFRERIKIDGKMISQSEVVEFVERNKEAIERIQPSFFEITSAMAFDHFARHGVDIAVIETGLGGRLDSTNVIRPLVSVITNISFDHSEFLGDTLAKIAVEKAGIIKEGTPVVVGQSDIETKLIFINRSKQLGAPILFADQCYRILSGEPTEKGQRFEIENLLDSNRFSVESDLGGDYQRMNVLTVLTTLDVLNGSGGLRITAEAVLSGISSAARTTGLMGRWQIIGRDPLTVCDTGHNQGGIAEITAQIGRQKYEKLHMVIGFVKDKDLPKILPLLPTDAEYIFTQASTPRALDANDLCAAAAGYGLHGKSIPSVPEALTAAKAAAAPGDMIFVGGSTYVVAELPEELFDRG